MGRALLGGRCGETDYKINHNVVPCLVMMNTSTRARRYPSSTSQQAPAMRSTPRPRKSAGRGQSRGPEDSMGDEAESCVVHEERRGSGVVGVSSHEFNASSTSGEAKQYQY